MNNIENAIIGDNFIGTGNISHGDPYGILLYDGFLDYTWFAGQNLRGKVFFLNSCEVANDPMESAMMNSGHARTFAGGYLDLPISTSVPAFQDRWNYTLNGGQQMGDALTQAAENHGLQGYYKIFGDAGIMKQPVAASISGPTYLALNQIGTYTCSASGGIGPYNYQWWKEENGVPSGPVPAGSVLPNRPAPGNWYKVGTDSPTLQSSDITNFSLECVVTDAKGGEVTSNVLSVIVSGSQSLAANGPGSDATVVTAVPTENSLSQNYPNPFNPSTEIRFALAKPTYVTLFVYDMLGRQVGRLADEQMDAGYHSVTWNASGVSSGVYIYRLTAGNFVQTKRMAVMK